MGKKKVEQDTTPRISRGGSWGFNPSYPRVAYRFSYAPGYRCADLGLRLVRRRSALEWLAESLREVSDEQEG